VFLNINFYI